MAISKTGNEILKDISSPLSVGFGAMSYGSGQSSLGGAAAGTAAATVAGAGVKKFIKDKLLSRFGPIGKGVGFLSDLYLSSKAYNIGDKIGNKVMPIMWSKNRLPYTQE